MRLTFKRQDALFLIAAALGVVLYVGRAGGGFPLDDSWIHQVYGRNLAQSGLWAFVPGVESAASTSPLYTVLLSIGYRLGLPYALWTHMLGVLALTLLALCGARLAEAALPEQKRIGLITGLALVLTWHLLWSAASGMETALFGAWTLALMVLAWNENTNGDVGTTPTLRNMALSAAQKPDRASPVPTVVSIILRGGVFGAVAALATLTRPEGVLLAGLAGLTVLTTGWPQSWRGVIAWGVGAAVGFGVFMTPYLALNLQLTGGLLPNTAAAKQAEYAPLLALPYFTRLMSLITPLLAGGQILLIPGLLVYVGVVVNRVLKNRREVFYLLPLLWAVGLIGLYAARLPVAYQHGRYVIPALPALLVMGVVGTAWLLRWGRRALLGRVLSRALALAAGLGLVYFALVVGPQVYRTDVRIIEEEMVASAQWIAEHIPLDDLLAVHDIGAVGYFVPRPILDLAGLVSPEVVPIIRDQEPLWELLRERGARYLMAFPDQIPGGDTNDSRLCPVYTSGGQISPSVGGPNMTIYQLIWNGTCSRN